MRFVFFFQAEDGIRDVAVTGVQTCALPISELNAYGNRPWAEGLKGERIDEYWLANQLRRYGVRPKTLWVQGVAAKGYVREDFEEVFRRYITPRDVEEATGESESSRLRLPSSKEVLNSNE